MSDIYKKINELNLEKEEIIKLKSYLVGSQELREQLNLALASCESKEEENGILQNFFHNILREKRQSTESHGSNKKQKLDPLFESICEAVKDLGTKLTKIQQSEQEEIISHTETLAVVERRLLFVRKIYKLLYSELKKKSKDGLTKFLITGTSGIGKSCFLIYILMQLLYEGSTIIFQPVNDEYFYCFQNLKLIRGEYNDFLDILSSPDIWYLADGITSPKSSQGKTVIAISPNGIGSKEYQQFEKNYYVKEYCMEPWSLKELEACRQYVFPKVPKEIMINIYNKAGGIPRYVLTQAEISLKDTVGEEGKPNDKEKEKIETNAYKRIEYAISEIDDFDKIIKCFNEKDEKRVEISNRIVHRWPGADHCEYYFKWASPYVFDRMHEKLEAKSWDDCLHKIRAMRDPYVASARGFLFECYVIHLFRVGCQTFETRKLKGTGNGQFSIENKPKAERINNATDLSKYSEKDIVIVPDSQNFGAPDLFVTPNNILQVTVSKHHPIKQAELVNIIINMPVYQNDRSAKIRLYFVVPDDIYNTFEHQTYTTRDKDSKQERPVKRVNSILDNVEQWAMKVQINPILE
ncbi:hypothetical protein RhiirA4_425906 [Rhizophagus irregularis]|uniref:Crinkler family protein n=1 Tax=Rhizophagus irregularis TaxID=588596 RepID=A0A2I1H362_9GLOM|nr:hypothetical protein RhiirA4_425906 [Rhizophagus irregularis]